MKIWSRTKIDKNINEFLIQKADLLEVVKFPDERLRQISKPINTCDDEIKKLVYDMLNTMYLTNGIGLAAPQIGKQLNLVVMDTTKDKNSPMVLINPTIIWHSAEKEYKSEGCLSVKASEELLNELDDYAKKQEGGVLRSMEVKLKYQDFSMQEKEVHADKLFAHCIQHELDHLKGTLYIDLIEPKELKDKFLNNLK